MNPLSRRLSRLVLAASALAGSGPIARTAAAQGWIIPRPPRPCICPPNADCVPCPGTGARVMRSSSAVRVELRDRVLHYQITEKFVNRGGSIGEADYMFPLPNGAAFQDLKLEINGQLVSGETLGAGEARQIYEEIVRRQRDPALVEWMGYGLLRARIFPINPGEEKTVVVRFQAVAQREGDALRIDYFRGAPRGNGGETTSGSDGRSSFVLTYPREQYGRAYSPTHELSSRDDGDARRVEVRGDARELTLLLPVARRDAAAISVLPYAPGSEDGFVLVTLSPPAEATRHAARDVTFVVDVSGSMSGRKLEQARQAGIRLLRTLDRQDRFRIIDFSTDVRSFPSRARDGEDSGFLTATSDHIADGERYLAQLQAEGSTNISGALEEALRPAASRDRLALVLFLTDGEPTVGERNPDAIADRTSRLRGTRRLFTFGVGADINVSLVERLALEGHGTAQFVRPDEDVERAVGVVASRLTEPVATDLVLRADGVRLSRVMPNGPVDLFAGQDLVVLARYSGSGRGALSIEGASPSGPVRWTQSVRFPDEDRDNAFVARLWATRRVGWLSAERRRAGSSTELDNELRDLGERYGIPTELTSYLVREPVVTANGIGLQSAPVASSGARLRRESAAGAGAAASAPAMLDMAKAAGEQRATSSLADADARTDASLRRVGTRTFRRDGETWIDSRRTDGMKTITVRAYSDAYFELLRLIPDLKDAAALGDHVVIAGKRVAIEFAKSGVERLTAEQRSLVARDW